MDGMVLQLLLNIMIDSMLQMIVDNILHQTLLLILVIQLVFNMDKCMRQEELLL
ncbi:hypothetical protein D3C72_2580530 [compost metagenome]